MSVRKIEAVAVLTYVGLSISAAVAVWVVLHTGWGM